MEAYSSSSQQNYWKSVTVFAVRISSQNFWLIGSRWWRFVQNYACRIVTDLKKSTIIFQRPLSPFNAWLNVKEKVLFNDLVMVYKCMNNLNPDYLRERFQERSEIHQRQTRQKSNYVG